MENMKLPEEISRLVDHLRSKDPQEFSLTDIASVTEVLVTTMVSYLSSIDASIYNECRSLTEYIAGAKDEIAALSPGDDDDSHIPRAGKELDAIVEATEEATDTIMNAAESVMNLLDEDDLASQRDKIEASMMEIFEACSFQDITGQRINKVVETFNHIEGRVTELRDLMGVTDEDIEAAQGKEQEKALEKHDPLARGATLKEEGIEQDEVDALLNDSVGEESEKTPPPEPEKAVEAEKPAEPAKTPEPEKPAEPAKEAEAEKKAEPKPEKKAETKKAPAAEEEEEIDQAAIDALFN